MNFVCHQTFIGFFMADRTAIIFVNFSYNCIFSLSILSFSCWMNIILTAYIFLFGCYFFLCHILVFNRLTFRLFGMLFVQGFILLFPFPWLLRFRSNLVFWNFTVSVLFFEPVLLDNFFILLDLGLKIYVFWINLIFWLLCFLWKLANHQMKFLLYLSCKVTLVELLLILFIEIIFSQFFKVSLSLLDSLKNDSFFFVIGCMTTEWCFVWN